MPDIAETDSYAMLCEDWGDAYQITRTPAGAPPTGPNGGTIPPIRHAAGPGALRALIRADYLARPVPREVAP